MGGHAGSRLTLAIGDASAREVVGADFDGDFIARHNANSELSHASGQSAQNDVVAVVELYPERSANFFDDRTGCFNRFFLLFLIF